MTTSYYELLDVAVEASIDEIKRAYAIKLRQYSNEAAPEVFQQIQDAYHMLSNEQKRADYDYQLLYGDRLAELESQAWDAFQNNRYKEAKKYFQQMLDIKEDNAEIYNCLGRCDYEAQDYEAALRNFKKAILLEDKAVYYHNLATTYEEMNDADQAIRTYKKMLVLNPTEIDTLKNLSALYMRAKEYEKAWFIVENALKKINNTDQIQFLLIYRLFELAIYQEDLFEVKIARKYLSKFIAQNSTEIIDKSLFELYEFALELQKYKNYQFSYQLMKIICEFAPYDTDYQEICQEAKENYLLYAEINELLADESLLYEIRKKTYLYMYSDRVDDFEEQVEEINEALIELSEYENRLLNAQLRQLQKNYPLAAARMDGWISALK